MKLAVPDLISNSYFPAAAAVELGFFRDEGLEVGLELIFPVDAAYRALAEGRIDFVGGSAHSALAAFPEWQGVKLLCAQAQGMYWFLVMRTDLGATRGDLSVLRGRRIGAAPWVEMGLRRLLAEAGIDLERDRVTIMPVPGTTNPARQGRAGTPIGGSTVNFGLNAAKALEEGRIDGLWANGMGTEIAVKRGVGTVVLDVRRSDGPQAAFNYTMSAVAAADRLIATAPEAAAAAVRAIVRTQQALRQDVGLAAEAGRRLFPPEAAALIADIIRRDLPFYDAHISRDFVAAMNRFCRDLGILQGDPPYEEIVAAQFAEYWQPARNL
jgi:NitT/TauT family transport system substrate-binding protein